METTEVTINIILVNKTGYIHTLAHYYNSYKKINRQEIGKWIARTE